MDRDTAELLLAEVATLWPTTMTSEEIGDWNRTLRPSNGRCLDAEISAEAILHLTHSPSFAARRPRVTDFLEAYEWCARFEEIEDPVAEREASAAALALVRSLLATR
jgi:hypothetical protein